MKRHSQYYLAKQKGTRPHSIFIHKEVKLTTAQPKDDSNDNVEKTANKA